MISLKNLVVLGAVCAPLALAGCNSTPMDTAYVEKSPSDLNDARFLYVYCALTGAIVYGRNNDYQIDQGVRDKTIAKCSSYRNAYGAAIQRAAFAGTDKYSAADLARYKRLTRVKTLREVDDIVFSQAKKDLAAYRRKVNG